MTDLDIYLNDHLAGSVGALEMLDDVIDSQKGNALEPFLKTLRAEIDADQNELRRLMKQLEIGESAVRKAGAWMAEKLSRVKLRAGDSGKPNLALLQSLEGLSLGIRGKRSLWLTLQSAVGDSARVDGFDFSRLAQRALDQAESVQARVTEIGTDIFPPALNKAE